MMGCKRGSMVVALFKVSPAMAAFSVQNKEHRGFSSESVHPSMRDTYVSRNENAAVRLK